MSGARVANPPSPSPAPSRAAARCGAADDALSVGLQIVTGEAEHVVPTGDVQAVRPLQLKHVFIRDQRAPSHRLFAARLETRDQHQA